MSPSSSSEEDEEVGGRIASATPAADLGARQSFAALSQRLFGHRPQEARIEHYVLRDKIASGGGGAVYRAWDESAQREVALKLLLSGEESRDAPARARLLREARSLARIEHEHIVRIYGVGTYDPAGLGLDTSPPTPRAPGLGVFVAMEYVQGKNLARWLADAPRSWREVRRVFSLAGSGLAAAHEAGLVHRDFKPANVLVGDDGRVKVADFGLAKAVGPVASAGLEAADRQLLEHAKGLGAVSLDLSLTASGAFVGTVPFMAPEQIRGAKVDARADQYSFCVALYEGMVRSSPFPSGVAAEVVRAKERGEFLGPPRDTKVPSHLLAVLRRGMAPDPQARYPSMPALLEALRWDPQREQRRRLLWGLGLGLGLGASALVLWASTPDPCEDARRRHAAAVDDSRLGESAVDARFKAWGARLQTALGPVCEGAGDREGAARCLSEQSSAFESAARISVEDPRRALAALERLPAPTSCSGPVHDTAPAPVETVSAFAWTGRADAASSLIDSWDPAEPELLWQDLARADLVFALGNARDAEQAFAALSGRAPSNSALLARAGLGVLEAARAHHNRREDARDLARRTLAAGRRAQLGPLFEARSNLALAHAARELQQPSEALGALNEALDATKSVAPAPGLRIEILELLATTLEDLELHTEAQDHRADATALRVELFGPSSD